MTFDPADGLQFHIGIQLGLGLPVRPRPQFGLASNFCFSRGHRMNNSSIRFATLLRLHSISTKSSELFHASGLRILKGCQKVTEG